VAHVFSGLHIIIREVNTQISALNNSIWAPHISETSPSFCLIRIFCTGLPVASALIWDFPDLWIFSKRSVFPPTVTAFAEHNGQRNWFRL
jgi:hypothetical protein